MPPKRKLSAPVPDAKRLSIEDRLDHLENSVGQMQVLLRKVYAEVGPFQIFVRWHSGATITFLARHTTTIWRIKEMMRQSKGIPVDGQRLIYGGKILEDTKTLEDCGIQRESTLHLYRTRAEINL